jgi:predicted nuclease of predicted toxin-antitoxin system
VKFLIDNQLPSALCSFIRVSGHEAAHVLDFEMNEEQDSIIWQWATSKAMVVVSKDEDFVHLANRLGDTGRLLWVRVPNCRKPFLLQRFSLRFDEIIAEFGRGAQVVELR